MSSAILLVLRRLRPPLIVLIGAYAIAVVGFTLMPGVDDAGNPWRMGFFEAFYVVSYTGSTIGFGEVPYEFSGAQRLWTIVSIYLTVIAWLYSVGTIISLIQDQTFRAALTRSQLNRSVQSLTEPFWLVCGFGDTGRLLVRALTERRRRVVVVDDLQSRIDDLNLRELGVHVPAFCTDARIPDNLQAAGLGHRWCMGVLAVTDDDHVNLKIAISSKLLSAGLPVLCRAERQETAANMASFGTDVIINAYAAFADRLALAIRAPDTHRVYDWLSGIPHTTLAEHPSPPAGTWIICGYGRLGHAVREALESVGVETVIIDETPERNGCPPGSVKGKGTEANTLRAAGIDQATALLAGTADDADNLSIIMTARDIKPDLYLVARENALGNKALFQAARPELLVKPSYIIASKALSVLNAPLLGSFLDQARAQSNAWNADLAERIATVSSGKTPECWTVRISAARTPSVVDALEDGNAVTVGDICRDPRRRDQALDMVPLMLQREDDSHLLPTADTSLESGDRLVFCGTEKALGLMRGVVRNPNTLRYVMTGEMRPEGWLWRRLTPSRIRARPMASQREQ